MVNYSLILWSSKLHTNVYVVQRKLNHMLPSLCLKRQKKSTLDKWQEDLEVAGLLVYVIKAVVSDRWHALLIFRSLYWQKYSDYPVSCSPLTTIDIRFQTLVLQGNIFQKVILYHRYSILHERLIYMYNRISEWKQMVKRKVIEITKIIRTLDFQWSNFQV